MAMSVGNRKNGAGVRCTRAHGRQLLIKARGKKERSRSGIIFNRTETKVARSGKRAASENRENGRGGAGLEVDITATARCLRLPSPRTVARERKIHGKWLRTVYGV